MDPRNYFQDADKTWIWKICSLFNKEKNACQNILIFGARIKYVAQGNSFSVRSSALSFCSFYYEMLEKFVKKKIVL